MLVAEVAGTLGVLLCDLGFLACHDPAESCAVPDIARVVPGTFSGTVVRKGIGGFQLIAGPFVEPSVVLNYLLIPDTSY